MDATELCEEVVKKGESKIVLLVADGLGGLPMEPGGRTELEAARTPNLDRLAAAGICGLSIPVAAGITPGSGPGHLSLFGYDPARYRIGRGILEALGIGFDVGRRDVAIRGNFCTVDEAGVILDRRAGRIPTEKCVELCQRMRRGVRIAGVEVFIEPGREYRFVVVFRADGLGGMVGDTDPQVCGRRPLELAGDDEPSRRTAEVARQFIEQVQPLLAAEEKANMVLLRGFSRYPDLKTMQQRFGLDPVAIAVYPMYRGLAKLVGMRLAEAGQNLSDQIAALGREWSAGDFFFLHFKYTDSAGEDGDFAAKVARIEELDAAVPAIERLEPDVLIVTGDHSTPCLLRSHSWHPVPTLLAARTCRPDGVRQFGESSCLQGGLGQFPAKELLPLALAHAGRLEKFGA